MEGVDRGGYHWRNARSNGGGSARETNDVDEAGGSLASEQYAAEGGETMERQVVSRPSISFRAKLTSKIAARLFSQERSRYDAIEGHRAYCKYQVCRLYRR